MLLSYIRKHGSALALRAHAANSMNIIRISPFIWLNDKSIRFAFHRSSNSLSLSLFYSHMTQHASWYIYDRDDCRIVSISWIIIIAETWFKARSISLLKGCEWAKTENCRNGLRNWSERVGEDSHAQASCQTRSTSLPAFPPLLPPPPHPC